MSSKQTGLLSLALGSLLSLSACANTPWGAQVQQALEADPQLQENPLFGDQPVDTATPDLPSAIPIYPTATRQEIPPAVEATVDEQLGELTYWTTPDSPEQVQPFYQDALQSDGWSLVESSAAENREAETEASNRTAASPGPTPDQTNAETETPDPSAAESPILVAQRENLRVRVALLPTEPNREETAFTIQYQQDATFTTSDNGDTPQPVEEGAIGPTLSRDRTGQSSTSLTSQTFADVDQAPEELRSCVQDLAALGVLSLKSAEASNSNATRSGTTADQFKPNQGITRREYARWLFAANNTIYANRPEQRIRPGVASAQPAFQDVPSSDPDFAAIQGLAEAGLIPSPLSGNTTTVAFRPDALLAREDLLLWKVPLDTRQALPSASVEAVQQSWGFQDAAKIDPRALRAVLADHQNGEFSNIRRAFGYTTLFQPDKPVTRAEAAAVLCRFGNQTEGISAEEAQSLNRPSQGG